MKTLFLAKLFNVWTLYMCYFPNIIFKVSNMTQLFLKTIFFNILWFTSTRHFLQRILVGNIRFSTTFFKNLSMCQNFVYNKVIQNLNNICLLLSVNNLESFTNCPTFCFTIFCWKFYDLLPHSTFYKGF